MSIYRAMSYRVAVIIVTLGWVAIAWGAAVTVSALAPETLAVAVSAGTVIFPDSTVVPCAGATLYFDPPATRRDSLLGKHNLAWRYVMPAPGTYDASYQSSWRPWGGNAVGPGLNMVTVHDAIDITIGSGLYRVIDTVNFMVTNKDRSRIYQKDVDYYWDRTWAMICNRNNAITDSIRISYTVVPQRLDLVQINKSGVLSVKKGTSVYACPWLPEPDNNCLGLAGIYIATYDSFTIADRDIFIIDPAAPVMPINGYALKNTLAKLAGHQNIKMAFFGNSVTLGADATTADSCYRNRVEKGIQQYYGVTVTEVAAYQGGITIKNGVNIFNQTILPQHPDILLIKLGLNDAAGPLGGRANNPVLEFQENMRDVVKLAKANNIEVLLVATFRPHMFFDEGARMPEYRQAVVDLAHEQGVACADVFTEWENQATHGVPSESQLHNYHNHPGVDGHRLMAATILRAFDPATVPSPVASPAFGMYTDSVWVTLATATGTAVRYTTDGGEPTESALLYSGPVKLDATTVFKFRAFEAGLTPSAVTV